MFAVELDFCHLHSCVALLLGLSVTNHSFSCIPVKPEGVCEPPTNNHSHQSHHGVVSVNRSISPRERSNMRWPRLQILSRYLKYPSPLGLRLDREQMGTNPTGKSAVWVSYAGNADGIKQLGSLEFPWTAYSHDFYRKFPGSATTLIPHPRKGAPNSKLDGKMENRQ